MGTPDFAVPVLSALAGAGHEIAHVFTQPPRPAGRGKQVRRSPVHDRADALGLPVSTPERFDDAAIRLLEDARADLAIVVAYGQILPQPALDTPKGGCLNLHASLLPRWRGAAPIQRAIMAGDRETGVCVMQMEASLDTGPVLARSVTRIEPDETAQTLHDRLAEMSARLIVETLLKLSECEPIAQPETGVTYASKIEKSEARIDWERPAAEVSAHIRGLSPFPGAWTEIGGERCKILMALPEDGEGPAGEVLDDHLLIACETGAVRITKLQRAGKSAVDASAFLQGRPLLPGDQIG